MALHDSVAPCAQPRSAAERAQQVLGMNRPAALCQAPARSSFPTCRRRLQRPDVLGPEGAVSAFEALSTGEQDAELLVALPAGPRDEVRPRGCKLRGFSGELVRVVGVSGKMTRKKHH